MIEKVWAVSARLVLVLVGFVAVRAAAEPPSLPTLAKAIHERRLLVPEFRFIQEQARRLGIRVWLFGGSAAAFSHYVLRDLEGAGGDRGSDSQQFSYRYARIFRSTQDADLLVDGPEAAARKLEALLAAAFPHLQGGKKSAWEVRLLREDIGDKESPLNNANFRGQITESHSTGAVEISEPPPEESVVRDVRDWDNGSGQFLEDVRQRRLHFYFSETHGQTTRAARGDNPPIFAVIRYFTKALQYGLDTYPEEEPQLRKIIDNFDPERDLATPYAMRWLEHHAKKLFWHANDVERAWNLLERFGLRKALIRGEGPYPVGSLAWWLSKEPLRSYPVGQFTGPTDPRRRMAGGHPVGQTASELGIVEVAHDTSNFLIYETLVSSWDRRPNAFISRQATDGEGASDGDGLYARTGRVGGKFTNVTVHLRLNPEARDGVDFVVHGGPKEGAVIRLLNRTALTVQPENIDRNLDEYLAFVLGGGEFAEGDGGVQARIRMELRQSIDAMKVTPRTALLRKVRLQLQQADTPASYVTEVAGLMGRHLGVQARQRLLARAQADAKFAEVLLRDVWGRLRAAEVGVEELDGLAALLRIHGAGIFAAVADMLASDGWSDPSLWKAAYAMVLRAAEREPSEALVREMWLREPWVERQDALPRLVEALKITGAVTAETIAHIGVHEEWARRPEAVLLFRALAERTTRSSAEMFRMVMDSKAWSHLAIETIRAKVTREIAWAEFDQEVLRLDRAWEDPDFQEELLERWEEWRLGRSKADQLAYRTFVRMGLAHPALRARADYLPWVDKVLKDATDGRMDLLARSALLSHYFANPLVSDVEGMGERFLSYLRAHLRQRREKFSLSQFLEALDKGHWLSRKTAPALIEFLADALERFPALLRGENGGVSPLQLTTWMQGLTRRIPRSPRGILPWGRLQKLLTVPNCGGALNSEGALPP